MGERFEKQETTPPIIPASKTQPTQSIKPSRTNGSMIQKTMRHVRACSLNNFFNESGISFY